MNLDSRGRPIKYFERTVSKTFRLPVTVAGKLDTYENQTQTVIDALKHFFELDGKNTDWIKTEIQKVRKQESELTSLLKSVEQQALEKSKMQQREIKKWERLELLFQEYVKLGRSVNNPNAMDIEWIRGRLKKVGSDISPGEFLHHFKGE